MGRYGVRLLVVMLGCAALFHACVDFSTLSVPDPPSDASADGTPLGEDGGDAGAADGTFAGGRWCDVHAGHAYCFDFDNVGAPSSGWSGDNVSGGGAAVMLDPSLYQSPPNSMKSSVPNGDDNGVYAAVYETVPATTSRLVLAADVRPDLDGGVRYDTASFIALQVAGSLGFYTVNVGLSPDGPYLGIRWPIDDAGGYMDRGVALQSLDPDDAGWTRIEQTILLGPPLHVSLTFSGHPQWDGAFDGTVAVEDAGPMDIVFGIIATHDGGPLTVHYDNVTIDVK